VKLLWVATKAPWPSCDGGRLLLAETLRGLADHGHEIHVVAPADATSAAPTSARWWPQACVPHLVRAPARSLLRVAPALWRDPPLTIARHARRALDDEVARLVATTTFDVVHAEQLQALSACRPARERGIPIVLRAQNVESDLWTGVAACRPRWRMLAAREARRVATYEGMAVRGAAATVALTRADASRLEALAGAATPVHTVAAPLAAGTRAAGPALVGAPAVVLLASRGWLPSVDGARWFVRAVWPTVHARLPRARLHVFGCRVNGRGVVAHAAPATSREAFAQEAVMVVPLRIASGVRMKILEAWARGIPIVATPQAAVGLDAEPGRELLVARDGEEFATALALLEDPERRATLVDHARRFLRAHHDPTAVAAQLTAIAEGVASAARARR